MDKKHNNLAQPETDLMIKKSSLAYTEAIDSNDHTGIKLEKTASKSKQK